MPILITEPQRVAAAGQPPKLIDEYVGRVRTGTDGVSVAHMRSPRGWSEPGQRLDQFRLAVSFDAGDADDLAAPHLERHAVHALRSVLCGD